MTSTALRIAGAALAILLLPPTARSQATPPVDETPPRPTAIVPVVGNIDGLAGMTWAADVELRNRSASEMNLTLILPAHPGEPFFFTSIAPGQTLRLADIARESFDAAGAVSPLLIFAEPRESISVVARVRGLKDGREVSVQQIPVIYGAPQSGLRLFTGLSFNDDFRTNIGLANLSEEPATFVLGLQRIAGRTIASASISVPARSLIHRPLAVFFPLMSEGSNLKLLVEVPGKEAHAYASVIDNATGRAEFVGP